MFELIFPEIASVTRHFPAFMRPYSEVVGAKNILSPDLGPIGGLDSLVIKQISQLCNPYSGPFSISCPTVYRANAKYPKYDMVFYQLK